MTRIAIAVPGALVAVVVLGTASLAQSAYDGLTPVAGDDHQHAGSLISNYVAWRKQNGTSAVCPHDFGRPTRVFDLHREAGYDWSVIAHHDRATDGGMTGDPDGSGPEETESIGAYSAWWANPAATPLRLADGTPFITPNPAGLPDHVTGGTVTPGWNEALSLSSAAELKNRPEEGFVAFAGREFTTDEPRAVSDQPGQGGHKVVLLPGPSDRICGPLGGHQGASNDCDETELYRWVHAQDGIIIQAHPGSWAGVSPWHPATARAGVSDLFVEGVEIGRNTGIDWEHAFEYALQRGYRLFPSFGSDTHYVELAELGIPGCESATPPGPANGATLCWVPSGGMTRATILEAMRERRCYYARSHEPTLAFEMRDGASDPWRPMGSVLAVPDGQAEIRVSAVNDLANQTPSLARHFDRLELVQVTSSSATLLHACTDCCTRDPVQGDRCELLASFPISRGAIYPRICTGTGACGANGPLTVTVGAPVFVNWTPLDPSCDHDGDGVHCLSDNCWGTANPGQADADEDGVGDACDLCVDAPDPHQIDANGDGIGDACQTDDPDGDGWPAGADSCATLYSGVQRDGDGDAVGDVCDNCVSAWNGEIDLASLPSFRTATGGQVDDDADGYGNRCDGDFVDPSPAMDASDRAALDASIPIGGPYPATSDHSCGTSASLACDQFDVSVDLQSAALLNDTDRSVGLQIQASANAGPKCAACGVNFRALPCTGDACIACNDGLDNDGDGRIDYPDDPTCVSLEGAREEPGPFWGCGLGPELGALLALLLAGRHARRRFSGSARAR